MIMMSAVYTQSSDYDETDALMDPENRFAWRFQPRRFESEVIRDAMLAVSGQLENQMFGPGTLDDAMRRRSIYFTVKRSKLVPMMLVFDSPEPLVSVGKRPTTTIAPQALMFINNRQVRAFARGLARQLLNTQGESLDGLVREGFLKTVGRPPTDDELTENLAFLTTQVESYNSEGHSAAVELAASDFCQVLWCLNEFVYVD